MTSVPETVPRSECRAHAKELHASDHSIHYHVWDYPSFEELLQCVSANLADFTLDVVKSMKTFGEVHLRPGEALDTRLTPR